VPGVCHVRAHLPVSPVMPLCCMEVTIPVWADERYIGLCELGTRPTCDRTGPDQT